MIDTLKFLNNELAYFIAESRDLKLIHDANNLRAVLSGYIFLKIENEEKISKIINKVDNFLKRAKNESK